MEISLKEYGSVLGIRDVAKNIRETLEQAINASQTVILDFDGVDSVSSSFADELVAKAYCSLGLEKVNSFIRLRNANDFVKTIIVSSVHQRLSDK